MHVKISRVTTERIDMENKVFRIIEGMMKWEKKRQRGKKKLSINPTTVCSMVSPALSTMFCALQGWPCLDHTLRLSCSPDSQWVWPTRRRVDDWGQGVGRKSVSRVSIPQHHPHKGSPLLKGDLYTFIRLFLSFSLSPSPVLIPVTSPSLRSLNYVLQKDMFKS